MNKTKKDFEERINKAEDIGGCTFIAGLIMDEIGDKDLAAKALKKAADFFDEDSYYDYSSVAENVIKYIGDKDWAIKLFKEAEKYMEDGTDCKNLGDSVWKCIEDKSWVAKLYKDAEKQYIDDRTDFQQLAKSVYKNLNNREWAKSLLDKAYSLVTNLDEALLNAYYAFIIFEDQEIAVDEIRKSFKFCNNKKDFKTIKKFMKDDLENKITDKKLEKEIKEQMKKAGK